MKKLLTATRVTSSRPPRSRWGWKVSRDDAPYVALWLYLGRREFLFVFG